MNLKVSLNILLVFGLYSCAVTELTRKGSMVREFSHTDPGPECKFLGTVQGAGEEQLGAAGRQQSAVNDLKNKVAAKGGNFFKVQNAMNARYGNYISAEAYFCSRKGTKHYTDQELMKDLD